MNFQKNLKKYREKAGYSSAKDFAALLGVPYTTYMGYENKKSEPKYELLIKIAELLGITVDELLGVKKIDEFNYYLKIIEKAGFFYKIISDTNIVVFIPAPKNDRLLNNISSPHPIPVHFFFKCDFISVIRDAYESYEQENSRILHEKLNLALINQALIQQAILELESRSSDKENTENL